MGWEDVSGNESKKKQDYTKFSEGNTLIRILDSEPSSSWQHWINKLKIGVTCLGKGCPICSVMSAQKASNEKPSYNSSKRHAMRIWNYTTNKMEVMIQGKNFFEQLLSLHEEIGDLRTYDIKVIRKGSDTDTTYQLLPTAPKEFEHQDQVTDVDFNELFKPMEKEQMLQIMEGKTFAEVFGKKDEETTTTVAEDDIPF